MFVCVMCLSIYKLVQYVFKRNAVNRVKFSSFLSFSFQSFHIGRVSKLYLLCYNHVLLDFDLASTAKQVQCEFNSSEMG